MDALLCLRLISELVAYRRRPEMLPVKAGALTFGELDRDLAGVRQLPFQPEHSGDGMVTLG
jgi:hypothetical protein